MLEHNYHSKPVMQARLPHKCTRQFSTTRPSWQTGKSNSAPEQPQPQFKFSFASLSRGTKTGLVLVVVFATSVETMFYAQWVWSWWKKRQIREDVDNDADESSLEEAK
jgi:hypothetical protein